MFRKLLMLALLAAIVGFAIFWWLTRPNVLTGPQANLPAGDVARGEQMFWTSGCASCHAAPKASGDAKRVLAGGVEFKTPFGTFRAPNISPSVEAGIGGWSDLEFANAMLRGVSPQGEHYYPAFPFTQYARMTSQDIADLWAYLKTVPASDNVVADHDIGFPFNVRRGLGLWKLLYLDPSPVVDVGNDPVLLRGRYLVEGPAHCGACHTPRNPIGGMDKSRWLAGGVSPEGNERIPNITPSDKGIGGWSHADIVNALETGFTPEFDSFGSSMADVVENMAKLPKSDLEAMAAYLKAIQPIEDN